MRRLELEADQLVARFSYTPWLKDEVKALPGARFDWNSKTWRFHTQYAPQVVPDLLKHGFEIAAEVLELLDDMEPVPGGDAAVIGASTDNAERRHSITELNRAAARAIATAFAPTILLIGEVSGFERTRSRRHAYFELVERDSEERTAATIGAVMFESARRSVESALEKAGMPITDGMRVCFRGRVSIYEARGSYQFVIESVDTSWVEGEQAMRRERILRKLKEEGIVDSNQRLPLPQFPLRVALLTSADSDAMHDVLSSLRQSRLPFTVDLFDVRVQGRDLESTVTRALDLVSRSANDWDCVLITRGGGSRVELGGWDNEVVARALVACPVKVIVAIGHHQDRSLLDDIAHSMKTPTAAGELLVELVADSMHYIDELASRMDASVSRACATLTGSLSEYAGRTQRAAERAVDRAANRTLHFPRVLHIATDGRLSTLQQSPGRALLRLRTLAAASPVRYQKQRLEGLQRRLVSGAAALQQENVTGLASSVTRLRHQALPELERNSALLRLLAEKVAANDPLQVLNRGFVMLRDGQNRVVTELRSIKAGDLVKITMRDGSASATVIDVQPNE